MYCGNCGAEQPDGVQFCQTCGAPLPGAADPQAAQPEGGGKAVASLVLGIVGLLAWCLPLAGLPITITGLVLGIKSRGSRHSGMAVAGITLNTISLVATVINAVWGAYLGATGQHPLLQP